jgi:Na+/proline symporter
MSTIATQVNWGASYVVNDVYKRFVAKEEDFTSERAAQRNYIFVSRVTTFITIIFGLIVAKHMETVKQAWESILALGAGTGLVLILRWYWWRINAWSEISSMIASAVLFTGLTIANKIHPFIPEETAFAWTMLIIVGGSTLTWLLVTFLTRPEKEETLLNFYRKVRPGGIFWRRIGRLAPDIPVDKGLSIDLLNWFLGAVLIYGLLFGFGKLILGYTQLGIILTLVGLCGGFLLYLSLSKQGWERLGK